LTPWSAPTGAPHRRRRRAPAAALVAMVVYWAPTVPEPAAVPRSVRRGSSLYSTRPRCPAAVMQIGRGDPIDLLGLDGRLERREVSVGARRDVFRHRCRRGRPTAGG